MASIKGFSEGIILSLAFVAVLGVVIAAFNIDYIKNFDLGFNDDSNSSQLFIDFNERTQTQIQGGEAEFDAEQGITVKSSWGISKDVLKVTLSFVSGNWIEKTVNAWGLGEAGELLAMAFRLLYIITLIFAILYILFKVEL